MPFARIDLIKGKTAEYARLRLTSSTEVLDVLKAPDGDRLIVIPMRGAEEV